MISAGFDGHENPDDLSDLIETLDLKGVILKRAEPKQVARRNRVCLF